MLLQDASVFALLIAVPDTDRPAALCPTPVALFPIRVPCVALVFNLDHALAATGFADVPFDLTTTTSRAKRPAAPSADCLANLFCLSPGPPVADINGIDLGLEALYH